MATAALEVLREEKLVENSQRMGEVFRAGLRAMPTNGLVELVRGRGAYHFPLNEGREEGEEEGRWWVVRLFEGRCLWYILI